MLIASPRIEKFIYGIRGRRVMIDSDLATIFRVTTTRLNQQVNRNLDRFPEAFLFRLTNQEVMALMLQNATSKIQRGGRRKLPYAFTEYGVIMAANVLNSPTAVQASVQIVMAFVRLREMLSTHKDLSRRLDELEKKYDARFQEVFHAIRQLMAPNPFRKRKIGFRSENQ